MFLGFFFFFALFNFQPFDFCILIALKFHGLQETETIIFDASVSTIAAVKTNTARYSVLIIEPY